MKMAAINYFNRRARHSVRAVWDLPERGAHGVTRPIFLQLRFSLNSLPSTLN